MCDDKVERTACIGIRREGTGADAEVVGACEVNVVIGEYEVFLSVDVEVRTCVNHLVEWDEEHGCTALVGAEAHIIAHVGHYEVNKRFAAGGMSLGETGVGIGIYGHVGQIVVKPVLLCEFLKFGNQGSGELGLCQCAPMCAEFLFV